MCSGLSAYACLLTDTTKMYEETYKKKPDKGPACPPPGGPYCENPGGSPKDPLISRPSAFDKIKGPVPVVIAKKAEAAPKKEAEAAPKEAEAAPKE